MRFIRDFPYRCNSTYRLRYWNDYAKSVGAVIENALLQQYLPLAVLKQNSSYTQGRFIMWLQQYLPLAVLKQIIIWRLSIPTSYHVATVLTACGIETAGERPSFKCFMIVVTVLTACGIETFNKGLSSDEYLFCVATVLTACGIETLISPAVLTAEERRSCNSTYRLRYRNTTWWYMDWSLER